MDAEILSVVKEIQAHIEGGGFDWSAILPAVVGGTLALLGAFGLQTLERRSVNKQVMAEEHKKTIQKHAQLLNEFENHLQKDYAMSIGLAGPNELEYHQ